MSLPGFPFESGVQVCGQKYHNHEEPVLPIRSPGVLLPNFPASLPRNLKMAIVFALSGSVPGLALAQAEDTAISEVVVTGRAQELYRVDDSSFATRTPTNIMDIPQSVQVLTSQLIEDQAARDISDLYRSISGMTFFSYSGVTFRGFRQDEVRYDGVRGDPFAGFAVPQVFNIDRIEVLKGVSGMLYGSGEPGGLINYVTRKPAFSPQAEIELTVGNRDLSGISAQAEGPLPFGDGETLAYRVGAFHEEEDAFRNNAGTESDIFTGALTWQVTPDTELTAQVNYYDVYLQGNRLRGVPVDDAGNFLTDIAWNTNEASDFLAMEATIGQLFLSHRFSDSLTSRTTLRYVDNKERQQYHESRGPAAPGSTLYLREFRDQMRDNDEFSVTSDFILEQTWGGLEHTLLFGGELFRQDSHFLGRTARQFNPLDPDASLGPVQPLDLLHPVYGNSGIAIISEALDAIPFRPPTDSEVTRGGVYVQDQITLNPNWQVVLGGRYDDFEDRNPNAALRISDSALSLRGGLIFKPLETLSFYFSAGEGFVPQGVVDPADGGPFDPQHSMQLEFGVKARLFNDRIMASAAVYDIVKDNVLVGNPDPNAGNDGVPNLLQIGEVTSRGLEIDLVGDITDNWTFQANYAYNHVRITGGPPGSIDLAVGDEFPNAPSHSAGLWMRYQFPVLNSAIAGGIDFVSERISFSNQRVKPYTVADISWITEWERWKFQVNVRNLFDREYAASGFNQRNGHFPGAPLTVVGQLTRRF